MLYVASAIIWGGLYYLLHGSELMMWLGAAFGYVFFTEDYMYFAQQFQYEYVDEITFIPAVLIACYFFAER